MTRMHRRAPFLTWPNAWFNAPCAFWQVRGGTPVAVQGSRQLPADPDDPVDGRRRDAVPGRGEHAQAFPTARMVVETGGNHGVALGGNQCVDRHLVAYLIDGTMPPHGSRAVRRCRRPVRRRTWCQVGWHGHERLTEVLTR